MAIKKKKSGSRGRASAGAKKRKLLRTPFMAEFTKEFIGWGPDNWLWPKTGQKRADVIADFQAFVKVLLTVGYGLPAPTGNGSPGDQVVQFLSARKWPSDPTGIPQKFMDEQPTVRLVEIAVILDRLLRAINSFEPADAAGGGGSNWPPH